MQKEPWPWRLLRWLYAAFYLFSGLHWLGFQLGLAPGMPLQHKPAAAALAQALTASGIIDPAVAGGYVLAGAAMLFHRTAPLGLLLLAPLMVVIFLFNTVLNGSWIWGTANTVILLALTWHFRSAYRPLWNHQAAPA